MTYQSRSYCECTVPDFNLKGVALSKQHIYNIITSSPSGFLLKYLGYIFKTIEFLYTWKANAFIG